MRILVTGASGFVGSLLVPRLLAEGHAVRALGRDPARVTAALAGASAAEPAALTGTADLINEVEVLRGDALSGAGLARALAHVDVAYYLIHSMERPPASASSPDPRSTRSTGTPARPSSQGAPEGLSSPGSFAEREQIAARNFAAASARARVARIVYLGGLLPPDRVPSRHLASREAVERILLRAVPDSLALRAPIVIGARSRSFRFLVRLVERLPVLTLPAWRSFRTQPIDERDVIEMLTAAATVTTPSRRTLDLGGPDLLTYEEMISRIADLMLVRRPVLGFGVNLTPVAARIAAAIAAEDPELILPLMESLQGDLLPADDRASELLDVNLHSFDSAVEHALRVWERSEPLAAR
ncbi:MAG TPA: NAD(P)H-binding protein [Solirubrobacteraceae bacterium]